MSLRRWTASLEVAANPRLGRDRTATHRADVLSALSTAPAVTPEVREQARRATRYWRRIARLERRRLSLYGVRSLAVRAVSLARLVLVGDDRPVWRGAWDHGCL